MMHALTQSLWNSHSSPSSFSSSVTKQPVANSAVHTMIAAFLAEHAIGASGQERVTRHGYDNSAMANDHAG